MDARLGALVFMEEFMTDNELRQMAIAGNKQIETAILELLKNYPYGPFQSGNS